MRYLLSFISLVTLAVCLLIDPVSAVSTRDKVRGTGVGKCIFGLVSRIIALGQMS